MCPAPLEIVLSVQMYSGGTHDKRCPGMGGSKKSFVWSMFHSVKKKKKSSANFPLLLPRHLLGMARRGSRGTGEFSFHDSFIPGLLCGNSQQVVDWWQLSWRVCDVDTQTISILHKSHSRAFPLQVSKTRAVSKPEKPHLCFLTNPHLNHLSVCCLFNVYVLW